MGKPVKNREVQAVMTSHKAQKAITVQWSHAVSKNSAVGLISSVGESIEEDFEVWLEDFVEATNDCGWTDKQHACWFSWFIEVQRSLPGRKP